MCTSHHTLRYWSLQPGRMIAATLAMLPVVLVFAAAGALADDEADRAWQRLIDAHRKIDGLTVDTTVQIEMIEGDVASDTRTVEATLTIFPGETRNSDAPPPGVLALRGYTNSIDGDEIVVVHESSHEERCYVSPSDVEPYWPLLLLYQDLPLPHLAIYWAGDNPQDMLMLLHPHTPELQPTRVSQRTHEDRAYAVIELTGADGSMQLWVDPDTDLLARIEHEVNAGQFVQSGVAIRSTYELRNTIHADDGTTWASSRIAVGDRTKVDSLGALIERPRQAIANAGNALTGEPAPEFVLATADGGAVALRDLRNRVVVLDFWATWCGPCIQILPDLHRVAQWAEDEAMPVDVITVNVLERVDGPDAQLEAVRAFWREHDFSLPVAIDYSGDVARDYGIRAIPMTVIIRADGIVHTVSVGAKPDYAAWLRESIEGAIAALEDGM